MPIFRSQTKERQRVATIEAQQFCFWLMNLGMLVLWISICYRSLFVHSARVLQQKGSGAGHWGLQDTSAQTFVDHQCAVAQSYNFMSLGLGPFCNPGPFPVLGLAE